MKTKSEQILFSTFQWLIFAVKFLESATSELKLRTDFESRRQIC